MDNIQINEKGFLGFTPLYFALKEGHNKFVQLLLQTNKVEINQKGLNGEDTALHWTCIFGNSECVRLLLKTNKVEINQKNKHGSTALDYAYEKRHSDCVRLLLQTDNIEVNEKDENIINKNSNIFK